MKKSVAISVISVLAILAIVFGAMYFSNNANKTEEISRLQADVDNKSGEIAGLQTNVESMTAEIAGLKEDVAGKAEQISSLQADVESKAGEIKTLKSTITAKEEAIQKLEADMTAKEDESKYKNAQSLLGKGQYSEAAEIFDSLGSYEDSTKLSMYAKAVIAGESGDYETAFSAFRLLEELKDSKQLLVYYQGRRYQSSADSLIESKDRYDLVMAKNDYDQAAQVYSDLSLFKDCQTRLSACQSGSESAQEKIHAYDYAEADALEQAENFEEAMQAFIALGSYSDSAERVKGAQEKIYARDYASADKLEQDGKYEDAIEAFIALGSYSDSADRAKAIPEKINARDYAAADKLKQAGKYEEAIEAFTALGDYSDSKVQIEKCHELINERSYQAAVALQQAGNYEEAIKSFSALGDYSDSKVQIEKCHELINERSYQAAVALQQAGNYEEAIKSFSALGNYSDSKAQIEMCHELINERSYQAAVALQQAGNYEEAIEAFTALGDYRDSAVQIKETNYQATMAMLKAGKYAEAYVAFKKLTGYKDVDSLLATDENLLAAEAREARLKPWKTVGGYVKLGTYPQTKAGTDATPIEWLVLDVQGNKALLISRYALDCQPYNTEWKDITWKKCTLRTWLNSEFLSKAFSADEQEAILMSQVDNSSSQGYSGWGTAGGNNTQDKIFLLSYAEAWKYFADDASRKCAPTDYAVAQGGYTSSSQQVDGKATGRWWLRSPGYTQNNAACVNYDGSRGNIYVGDAGTVVRPAFWINLESDIF